MEQLLFATVYWIVSTFELFLPANKRTYFKSIVQENSVMLITFNLVYGTSFLFDKLWKRLAGYGQWV